MTAPASWAEPYLIRALGGGPVDGDRVIRAGDLGLTWPLPDTLAGPGGQYRKVSESALPPQTADSHLVRGAEYRWEDAS